MKVDEIAYHQNIQLKTYPGASKRSFNQMSSQDDNHNFPKSRMRPPPADVTLILLLQAPM